MARYEDVLCSIWILESLILLVFKNDVEGIKAIEYPVNTTYMVGDNIQFTCEVHENADENNALDWYIEWPDDTEPIRRTEATVNRTIQISDRPEFAERGIYITWYFFTEEENGIKKHTCQLSIMSATYRDNGWFGCTHQSNPTDSHRTLLKAKARLYVIQEISEDPICRIIYANSGYHNVTCSAAGGMPPALVTWYKDDIKQAESYTGTVTLWVPVDIQRHEFVCSAQQGTLTPKWCSVTLNPRLIPPATSIMTSTTEEKSDFISTETVESDRASTVKTTESTVISTRMATTRLLLPVTKDNSGAVIGSVLAILVLLILILLLLFLFYRKRKEKRDPENRVEVALPDLPTLEPSIHPIEENPYGTAETLGAQAEPEPDFDELEKPWKNNPDLLMALENDGYSDDADSATESNLAANVVEDQPYENYTVP